MNTSAPASADSNQRLQILMNLGPPLLAALYLSIGEPFYYKGPAWWVLGQPGQHKCGLQMLAVEQPPTSLLHPGDDYDAVLLLLLPGTHRSSLVVWVAAQIGGWACGLVSAGHPSGTELLSPFQIFSRLGPPCLQLSPCFSASLP
jgi:hypothetical protein